jgi:rubrerythrin
MALTLHDAKGTPLDRQRFTWREMAPKPISKLDCDAFTRVRVILMNGLETDALRTKHVMARFNGPLRPHLAEVRRVEQHQATMVNWLLGADHSPLETTIGYEQVAIEITAAVAQREPDPYIAQTYRFGLLEDFDHLYRYSALLDRLEGKDSNNITQCYTDIAPGRATVDQHRHPSDDLVRPYDRRTAHPLTKLHAIVITASENQTHDYYQNIGPLFADPVARQLYAEIASVEEQHVTQYESLLDPTQTPLEMLVLHEATEAYCYYGCVQSETDPRIRAIWERMLDYELGHLQLAIALFRKHEGRDVAEILPESFPEPIAFEKQREFVRGVLDAREGDLRRKSTEFVPMAEESRASIEFRTALNRDGSPSDTVSAGYLWTPGTELAARAPASLAAGHAGHVESLDPGSDAQRAARPS